MAKIYNIKSKTMGQEEATAFCDSLENKVTCAFNEDISIDIIDTETMKVLKYKSNYKPTSFTKDFKESGLAFFKSIYDWIAKLVRKTKK